MIVPFTDLFNRTLLFAATWSKEVTLWEWKTKTSYTIIPGKHSVSCLWPCRQKIIPPNRRRNSGFLCARTKYTTVLALWKLTTFIIEVFCSAVGNSDSLNFVQLAYPSLRDDATSSSHGHLLFELTANKRCESKHYPCPWIDRVWHFAG